MSISIGFGAFYGHLLALCNSQFMVGSDSGIEKIWQIFSTGYEFNNVLYRTGLHVESLP